MSSQWRYPKEVFSAREDVTRNNMKEYDRKRNLFFQTLLEINPDYYNLGLKDRIKVRENAEAILGYRV